MMTGTPLDDDRDGVGWRPADDGTFWHLARAARDNGYMALIPIQPGRKACYEVGWPKWRIDWPSDATIKSWIVKNPMGGFGYAYDNRLVGIDLDISDPDEIQRHYNWLMDNVEGVPMVRIGRAPKVLVVYRADAMGGCYGHTAQPEIYFDKGQTVFFGIHPDTQAPYRWQFGSPATRPLAALPPITGRQINMFLRHFSGDPTLQYRAGSSSIIRMQKFAKDNRIQLDDVCLDGVRVIACAGEGNRHEIVKCAIAYAIYYYRTPEQIEAIMRPAYMRLFASESIRIQRNRGRDFDDLLAWAREHVVKRATGVQAS